MQEEDAVSIVQRSVESVALGISCFTQVKEGIRSPLLLNDRRSETLQHMQTEVKLESQERLNFSDVKGQVNRRRSLFSDCNNPRFWASRPSLVFIKPPTRIGNDNGLDSKERKKGAEDNETSDEETSTINRLARYYRPSIAFDEISSSTRERHLRGRKFLRPPLVDS
ncbi:hypothetical protein RB195_014798 [Necator americanus]|uniref:Uncharacterized protein n=1 Tax=Necator americanus TaxID=51031 RepID=A0ABR1E256_NECAM